MTQLLVDVNIEGHAKRLMARMKADYWREFWDHLKITLLRFRDIGLSHDAADSEVFQFCQLHAFYLLTDNRNEDHVDSLEATIRQQNTPSHLPVFTISDPDRMFRGNDYLERVVESLYDYLLRADTLAGVGRIYLP